MSCHPNPADRAHKIMNEIAALKRETDPVIIESNYGRIEVLKDELRELRSRCDVLTQGQIDSTLNPLLPEDKSSMQQGADPR